MSLIYTLLLYLITPFVLLRMAWLGIKTPAYLSGWARRLGLSVPVTGAGPVIWIHAVSVGEVQAAVPLVERLSRDHPQHTILISTITPTGAATVRRRFGDRVLHSYLPYDYPHAVRRFVNAVRPVLLLVMETEIWPNLFQYCTEHGISVVLVNARLSPRSYKGYNRIRCFSRRVIAGISMIGAQSAADGERFIALGASPEKVTITGNMKFDVAVPRDIAGQGRTLRRQLAVDRPVWIAASTHDGEEQLILAAHCAVLERYPSCLLILAPRHPERCNTVADLVARAGLRTLRKSQTAHYPADTAVVILDTLGELMVYYAAADLAFVGGSLLPCGGHNVLEPAALGIPVVTGKFVTNFTELNQLLLDHGAELQVDGVQELVDNVTMLLADPERRRRMGQAGMEIVERNRGSTDRVVQLIRVAIPA